MVNGKINGCVEQKGAFVLKLRGKTGYEIYKTADDRIAQRISGGKEICNPKALIQFGRDFTILADLERFLDKIDYLEDVKILKEKSR